jgi:hypothetical protein
LKEVLFVPIANEKEYRDKVLKCPFCLAFIEKVGEVPNPFGQDLDGGECAQCGARFIYERSWRRQGEAYGDAIAYAYDWDYDSVYENVDARYEEAVVRYNNTSGKYLLGEGDFKERTPKYFFIRRMDIEQEEEEV